MWLTKVLGKSLVVLPLGYKTRLKCSLFGHKSQPDTQPFEFSVFFKVVFIKWMHKSELNPDYQSPLLPPNTPSLPPLTFPPPSTVAAILSSHLPEISEHFSFTKFSLKESPSASNRTQSVIGVFQTTSRYPTRYWQVRLSKLKTGPRETGFGSLNLAVAGRRLSTQRNGGTSDCWQSADRINISRDLCYRTTSASRFWPLTSYSFR